MPTFEEFIAERFAGDPALVEDILRDNKEVERLYKENDGTISRLELGNPEITKRMREYDFFRACITGDIKTVKRSIKKLNVKINALDGCGRYHVDVDNGNEEILMKASLFASTNSPKETGLTGLDYAQRHNQTEVVEFLRKHGGLTSEEYGEKHLIEVYREPAKHEIEN